MSEPSHPERLNDRSSFQMNWVHGRNNPIGLHLQFEYDEGVVSTTWIPSENEVGFPGHAHGGVIAAVLDDTMGRVISVKGLWVVTARMEVRYRGPLRVGDTAIVRARMEKESPRLMTVHGEVLVDSILVAEATGSYMPLPKEHEETAIAAWPAFVTYLDEPKP